MPGSISPHDRHRACNEFRDEMQRVLGCISQNTYFFYRAGDSGERYRLVLPSAEMTGISELELSGSQIFDVTSGKDGNPVPTTVAYYYTLKDSDGPILRYEHHPDREGSLWPHLHVDRSGTVGSRQIGRLHLPTHRILLEHIVLLLHRDFKVPLLPDENTATRVLKETLTRHRQQRTWIDAEDAPDEPAM